MNFNSRKTSLIILGITALISSRAMFAFINDPEGPNLLIVVVLGAVVFGLSVGLSSVFPSLKQGLRGLVILILFQILIVSALYFCLK